jgi:putative DNA primase/helicase
MITFPQIETQLGAADGDTAVMGYERALLYLKARGIGKTYATELGLRICFASDLFTQVMGKKSHDDRLAIVFPHVDIMNTVSPWWSARLVPTVQRTGFAALAPDKRGKMFCPPGEPPVAYLVPTLDWTAVPRGERVYIHESAIKAANGARLDRWSLGLNGVRGWSAIKHGHALVDGLKDLPWRSGELKPFIVFDSNAATNPQVSDARVRLAAKLYELYGVESRAIDVPARADGSDRGFDDYCMDEGDAAGLALLDSEGVEIDVGEYALALGKLNSEVVVVRSLSRIVEIKTGTQMSRGAFTDVNYAHVCIVDDEGVRRNFPKMWLTDERRASTECLEYTPGGVKLSDRSLNLWNGMGCEPAEGDVQPWLDVLQRGVGDERLRKWIVQWLAYPIQNLGAKLNTFLHLYGPPGVGKNALLHPIMRIYGDNAVCLGRERVASDFNSVYACRQFVNLDELHGGGGPDGVAITNKIKMLVTGESIVVNTKGSVEYSIVNHLNVVTTSNYLDSLKLDEGDRRACVVQFGTHEDATHNEDYWTRYFAWAESEDGVAALYWHLLNVDITGFDPKGWAMETKWKELVTESARGTITQWVRDLWDEPSLVLPDLMIGCNVLTPEQLVHAYSPDDNGRIQGLKNNLGKAMQEKGFEREQVRIGNKVTRVWNVTRGTLTKQQIKDEFIKMEARLKGKF